MQQILRIADIVDPIDPIAPLVSNSVVYDRFLDTSDLMVLAVAGEDGQVLGLVERHTFNMKMAAVYGRALFGKKPVSRLMDHAPLMVEAATPLRDFTQAMLTDRPSELMRGFIVTEGGRYCGVCTSLAVLKAISNDLRHAFTRQQEMTADLISLGAEAQRHQTFLNTVIDNIPAMVLVKQAEDQRIVLMNPAGEQLLGVDAAMAVGKTSHDLFGAERALQYDALDRKALQSEAPVLLEEERFIDGHGLERVIQLKKTVLRNADGVADSILTLGLDLTDQKQAEAQIAHLAHYDPLTGLANRALFAKDMERMLARAPQTKRLGAQGAPRLAVRSISIASRWSMTAMATWPATSFLIEVATRLKKCVRKGDAVARMGGDEFAIIQEVERAEDAQLLAGRIIEAMKAPFSPSPWAVRAEVGVSVGIAHGARRRPGHEPICCRAPTWRSTASSRKAATTGASTSRRWTRSCWSDWRLEQDLKARDGARRVRAVLPAPARPGNQRHRVIRGPAALETPDQGLRPRPANSSRSPRTAA